MVAAEEIIGWRVEAATWPWRVAMSVDALVQIVTGSLPSGGLAGAWVAETEDSNDYIDGVEVAVRGQAPWLSPLAGWSPVECSVEQAWINYMDGSEHRRILPLNELTLTDARPRIRSSRPKFATAPWELHVTGTSSNLVFRGRWLGLAVIGTLAGWPEPPTR